MANSRFDNIKYFDGNSFSIPNQIKVYDGTAWVDLGTKYSYNTKKLNAYNGSSFVCVTYYRQDVEIPRTISIGTGKYLTVNKSGGSLCSLDTYDGGYIFDMTAEISETTPLYTCYTKNTGDITNQAYVNYIAEVSGNQIRIKVVSHFSGNQINTGKYINATDTHQTDYVANLVNQKIRILITRSSTNGSTLVRMYNANGTELTSKTFSGEQKIKVGTPNQHRVGSETTSTSGKQSSYGNAKIHYFKITPTSTRSSIFEVNVNDIADGTTKLNSTGTYSGYLQATGTSVYGSSYTEYIRQTI